MFLSQLSKEQTMKHIHRRFTVEQVRLLLSSYSKGRLTRCEVEQELGIGKTRFFALLQKYRKDPTEFSFAYTRISKKRLPQKVERAIADGLLLEQGLIKNPSLPISSYNYSALADRLKEKQNIVVSVPTIIKRAKILGCHFGKRRKAAHDREVITTAIGALIQHDSSNHLWSPYATEKWILITSLDDFSRKLLYADFVSYETTWTHIHAAQILIEQYGFPLRYYVDQLRVFRFIQGRDSIWRKHVLQTDDVDPQWRQVMRVCGIDVIYALSAQAKGKIERPYRWMQDRIVRTCALEQIKTIEQGREILKKEVRRYNEQQVHSTTKEIPFLRFQKAKREGNSMFRPFSIPTPYLSTKDLFCLREKRMVNSYHKVSLWNKEIFVPEVPLRDYVEIFIIPDKQRGVVDLRFWWNNQLVHTLLCP